MEMPTCVIGKISALALLIATTHLLVFANDWPQWRGPKRDGVVAAYTSPKSWPEQLKLKWKANVGEGQASPVVAGERIYLFTHQVGQEVVACLNLATGKQIWRNQYPVKFTVHEAAKAYGPGPKATPAIHNGKLYTVGVTGVMSCLDAATGKLLWRKEPTGGVNVAYPRFGMAISPLVIDGVLIAPVGGDRRTAAVAGFDANTGAEKWRWANDRMSEDDGPEYSSPIVVEVAGVLHLVTIGGKKVIGLAPDSGRLLWQYAFEADWESTVTPVAHNGLIIVSGHSIGMFAVRVNRQGNEWRAEQVWRNPDLFTFLSTPVAYGNWLFGLAIRNKGQYFCVDVNTGETVWVTQGREAENVALLRAGDDLFVLTNEATLIVAKSSAKGFEPMRRYQVADTPTWAHPVLLDKQILIKDASNLALWSFE